MDQEKGWAAREAAGIGRRIAHYRRQAELSAKQLSGRCAEIDPSTTLSREVIAKIENGRRETITVAELQVLARALLVSPADLMYPIGLSGKVELLPGHCVDPWKAVLWWSGLAERPGRPPSSHEKGVVHLYQVHAQLLQDWTLAGSEHRRTIVTGLRGIRGDMRERGLVLPELPGDVARAAGNGEPA